jgi:hypothetical protein
MFKVGDKVRILDNARKPCYEQILNKIGKIVHINTYTNPNKQIEETIYYVEIPEYANEYQSKGWWLFKNEQSLRLISDEVTCGDHMDAYEYCIRTRWTADDLKINKGDDKNMTILEIYEERRREKINKKYDDMENAIKQCDPRYKVWKDCVDKLSELYKEDKILTTEHFAPINLSDETIKKININHNARCEELNDLSDNLNEVRAQLSMCETYEQKQDILRIYKIIKENGKVNA